MCVLSFYSKRTGMYVSQCTTKQCLYIFFFRTWKRSWDVKKKRYGAEKKKKGNYFDSAVTQQKRS